GFTSKPALRTQGGPAGPSGPSNARRSRGGPAGPSSARRGGPVKPKVSGRVVFGGKQVNKARVRLTDKSLPPMLATKLPKGHPLPKGIKPGAMLFGFDDLSAKSSKPKTVTLHAPHTTTTVSTDTVHSYGSHGAGHGESGGKNGNGSHAFNGIGTLIINAEDGTVNVHIHGAAPTTKSTPDPKDRTSIRFRDTPPSGGLFLPGKDGSMHPGTKARASLMMARDAFQEARTKKSSKKPSKKKSSKKDSGKKKSSKKKINDETLSA
ncbi:MAG: hypothetical protein ACI89X_004823, partial [Planctomycetota bacterium]